ncbi:MAG: hypothetical protein JWO33_2504, partial [Caulobacteraceae bacterium]|nr:hypothetical protein [Caulobacteraceae bacterium]
AILGGALFGDQLTAAIILGGMLIIAGSLGVVLGEKTHSPDLIKIPPTPA